MPETELGSRIVKLHSSDVSHRLTEQLTAKKTFLNVGGWSQGVPNFYKSLILWYI